MMFSDHLVQFKTKLESLRGRVHIVSTMEQAGDKAFDLCQSVSAHCIAIAKLSGPTQAALERACTRSGTVLLGPNYTHRDLPQAMDRAEVGVSQADFAIAETGTLVEQTYDDAHRLVSSLPRVHIGIVSADEFVSTLEEAAPRLRTFFDEADEGCVVSFISGPSRTGDIELKLTLGVHGPEITHAIVVARPAPESDHVR